MKKILIDSSGRKYFVNHLDQDFPTPLGLVSKEDLNSDKTIIKTHTGKTLHLAPATFPDFWENLQRGPQIMLQKDIGLIISKTGINKESTVVDAGGGSGSLCLALANVCKQITVYEIHPEHAAIVAKNIRLSGLQNISLKQKDISLGISEQDLDLITLDLPEPWKVLSAAEKSLKAGGSLVIYLPNILQIKQTIDALKGTAFKVLETIELLERKWKIEERIVRPEFEMLGHTGFLIFCRRF